MVGRQQWKCRRQWSCAGRGAGRRGLGELVLCLMPRALCLMPLALCLVPLALCLVPLESLADAQQRYRYVNDQGVVVLDQSIPARFVDRGYTILGGDGHVIKVVASVTERKRQEEQQKVVDAEHKRQERINQSDQELLRMYSSPEDVERARDRKLGSIRTAIAITDANLQRLLAQKQSIEYQGAQLERGGHTVSAELVKNLRIVSGQIRDRQAEIATRKAELASVRSAFDVSTRRVRELYNYSAGAGARPPVSGSANAAPP